MQNASPTIRYGLAIGATSVCLLLRWLLWDTLGASVPYVTMCPAIVVSAYYGGFGPGVLATLLGGVETVYFLLPPVRAMNRAGSAEVLGIALYLLAGLLISGLNESLHRSRRRIQESEARQRITLGGIGDAVLVTDAEGRVTFTNIVAQQLTGWTQEEAVGRPLGQVFEILNETTRKAVENPVHEVLRSGGIVGLGNHTLLRARDGTMRPIDDSAAPVRNERGEIVGVVLIFRDVTEKRQTEREREERLAREQAARADAHFLAEVSDVLASSLDYEKTLTSVARLAISRIADGSMVHVVDETGSFRRLVIAHVNAEKQKLAEELFRRYPPDLTAPIAGLARVLNTGSVDMMARIPDGALEQNARDPEHRALLTGLGIKSYMMVPLCARERTLGALTFAITESERCYGPADLALAQDLARRAALAVDNARLYREAQTALRRREEALALHRHMEEQLTLLVEASSRLTNTPQLAAVSAAVLDLAHRMIAADAYAVWRLEPETSSWRILSSEGLSAEYLQKAGHIMGTALRMPAKPIFEEDAAGSSFFESRREAYRAEGIASVLALPLNIGDAVSGTLVFYYRTRRRFDDTTVRIATALANLAGAAITTAELYAKETALRLEAEDARERLGLLAEAGSVLASSLDYQSTLDELAKLAVPRLADWCVINLIEDKQIHVAAMAHADSEKIRQSRDIGRRYPLDPNATLGTPAVIRTGQSLFLPEGADKFCRQAARDSEHLEALRRLQLQSVMIVPLTARGRILGATLLAMAESGRRYTPEDLALAEELGRRAAVAIDNALLYRQLLDADRRKDEFLATLGHELRNPLSPLVSALHVLRAHRPEQTQFESLCALMARQLGVMVRLVDDLLDVSRITRGKIELRKERVDLAAIIKRAAETVQPLVEERRHALAVSVPAEPLPVLADPTRMEQVLANLLNNAAKYTPSGGRIDVTAEREGGEVVVRVNDSGIGIRAEMLLRIFDLFQQADKVAGRVQEGLGLGLTLVRRLIEMHGGRVTASSAGPGYGSEFVVRLPLADATEDSRPPADAARGMPVNGTRRLRVLIVDDNADAADSCALLLKLQGGHEVEVAYDGPSALELSARCGHDVVLLDIGLPKGMDGYEVCRRLRQMPHMEQALVAALTGYGQDEDRRRARDAGFTTHLTKPVEWPAIAELLAQAASV